MIHWNSYAICDLRCLQTCMRFSLLLHIGVSLEDVRHNHVVDIGTLSVAFLCEWVSFFLLFFFNVAHDLKVLKEDNLHH